MKPSLGPLCAVLAFCLSAPRSPAQRGDAGSARYAASHGVTGPVEEKEVVPRSEIPPTTPRTPEDEMKTFRLAPGFRIELVAEEPVIQDPIVLRFDADGRMYVLEMRGYMNTVDADGEEKRVGRVVTVDPATGGHSVFADRLVMARAVLPVGGGALVGEPPHLRFIRPGADGGAPSKVEIADNFGFGGGWGSHNFNVSSMVESMPNGAIWNIDNHIYCAEYTTRLRYYKGTFQVDSTTWRGEWGLTQDDTGRIYYNYNEDGLRGDLIPSQYTLRNPDQPKPEGVNVELTVDQNVWPIRVNPGVNRGYIPGILTAKGKLKEYTAACSPEIYRGGLFPPEFDGNCFVCEPAGNLVRRYVFAGSGSHLSARNAYDKSEFLASTDERFRPVGLAAGPDGCLYVVDMYHGIIEDKMSITSYLRRQVLDRGLQGPVHLGRIWRIVPEGVSPAPVPHLSAAGSAELVARLSDRNGWVRDTAQRLLVERGGTAAVGDLKELVLRGEAPLGRLHALWTLDGLESLDEATVAAALRDPDSRVRSAAVRVSEPLLREPSSRDRIGGHLLALTNDASYDVRLQLALSLGEAESPAMDKAAAGLMKEAGTDKVMAYAIASGLAHRELELLQALAADPDWKAPTPGESELVRDLSACVAYEGQPDRVARFFALVEGGDSSWRTELLQGFDSTSSSLRREPVSLAAMPPALAQLHGSTDHDIAKLASQAALLVTWPGKPGALPPPRPLTSEEQARFDQGRIFFNATCAACHQQHGRGMEGLAPPLAGSEWVEGTQERLVRIVLEGLYGRVKVEGREYSLEMPPWHSLGDEQLADILTYIRRAWGQRSEPVTVETVKRIRAETANHPSSWISSELEAIQ